MVIKDCYRKYKIKIMKLSVGMKEEESSPRWTPSMNPIVPIVTGASVVELFENAGSTYS